MRAAPGPPVIPAVLGGRRPTWIEIDLDALVANFRAIATAAGNRPLWCVVKADAYGHGASACGRALAQAGAAGLVVALPEEGASLRRAGIETPVLLSGPLPADGAGSLLEHRLVPALSRLDDLDRLQEAAAAAGKVIPFHLEVDTGMTRMGLPREELDQFLERAAAASHCRMEAVLSHLASVSRPDDTAARAQHRLFQEVMSRIHTVMGRQVPAHMASSPALCGFPAAAFDMVRPGLILYGVPPVPGLAPPAALQPVLSFRAAVILPRSVTAGVAVGYEGTWRATAPTRLAVISAGYADGLLRDVAGRAEALVGGRRVPYVGAVNMDLAQLDVGPGATVSHGDVATLIGRDGGDAISLEELCRSTGRTPYEWLTSLGGRVPRLVMREGRVQEVVTPCMAP